MNTQLFAFWITLFIFNFSLCSAQTTDTDQIAGKWKGTSLCQVKDSPCHDESVVGYFVKSNVANKYSLTLNKIVDGKEVDMGVLDFVYDSESKILTCIRDDSYKSVWKFKVNGKSIKGTLTTNGNTLFRIIDLHKD